MAELTKVKEGKNFSIWTDGKQKLIKIDRVRCSFPALGHMKENDNDDGTKSKSFQITPMLSKETHVAAKEAFVELMNELMKANDVSKMEPQYKAIKNGDDKDRKEYENHWIISCSDKAKRPRVLDVKGGAMIDPDVIDEKFYGGCWVSVMLRPWFFTGKAKGSAKTFPKRICCGIQTVQFIKDDAPFGEGRVDDSNAWGNAAEDGDDGLGGGSANDDDGL